MYCEKCGSEISRGAKFCEKCGFQVEPDMQSSKEVNSYKRWVVGGIIGGVVFVAVLTGGILFATGILGGNKEVVQTSIGNLSDTGGADVMAQPTEQPAVQSTEQPTATPVITSTPVPELTEDPVVSKEPEELMDARTPEETYKQYIETFVESVNTGNTDGLSQVLTGRVYKQQCEVVENYYNRGIQEELQTYSISSTKQVNDSCIKVTAKEIIKVFYEDGSTKVVKQKYCYVCKNIDSVWMIASMKETK